jgi:NADPH2:quinone reductase
VAVAAAGLNRADTLQRRGFYPAPPGVAADVPGLEFAGEVEQLGPGVTEWKLGDRVMGIVPGAGMATHVVTPAREALRVPASLSLSDAAAVPEAFLTAFDALFELGGLRQGELALIHSVASGVGTAAIQLCRAAGARSAGTSRTADKLARCQELGLDHALHSPDGRFAAELEKLAGGGADVILDTVGAAYLNENVRALACAGGSSSSGSWVAPRASSRWARCCPSARAWRAPCCAAVPPRRRPRWRSPSASTSSRASTRACTARSSTPRSP